MDVARRAFEDFDNVDAIVAPDLAAAAVLQEAERRSIRVPEDLQVIAYDGTYVSMFDGKQISAITQNIDETANRLVAHVMQEIERYAGDDTGVIGQTLLEKVSNDFQGYVSVTDTVEGVPYRFDAVKLEYIERETTIPLDDLGVE